MDFENQYEAELIFQVDGEDKKEKKVNSTKKILRKATENFKKLSFDRISGNTGIC